MNSSSPYVPEVVTREESLLRTNRVLRNTYLLLSMTLLFSAAMTVVSMAINVPPINGLIYLVGLFGLYFLVVKTRNSAFGIVSLFAFTGFIGFAMGPMLNAYLSFFKNGPQLIGMALGTTGIAFVGLSAYVLTSKKDFSFLGGFLFVGLISMIVLSLVHWFFPALPISTLMISAVVCLLMCGYILYDTSRIIHGGETNYIMATISLYLDIVILFQNLLNVFGILSGDD